MADTSDPLLQKECEDECDEIDEEEAEEEFECNLCHTDLTPEERERMLQFCTQCLEQAQREGKL